eukprot:1212941-Heterocapsa_arctica.AAC.1
MSDQGDDHERWRWNHRSGPDAYYPDDGGYWQWDYQQHRWVFHYFNQTTTEPSSLDVQLQGHQDPVGSESAW